MLYIVDCHPIKYGEACVVHHDFHPIRFVDQIVILNLIRIIHHLGKSGAAALFRSQT